MRNDWFGRCKQKYHVDWKMQNDLFQRGCKLAKYCFDLLHLISPEWQETIQPGCKTIAFYSPTSLIHLIGCNSILVFRACNLTESLINLLCQSQGFALVATVSPPHITIPGLFWAATQAHWYHHHHHHWHNLKSSLLLMSWDHYGSGTTFM